VFHVELGNRPRKAQRLLQRYASQQSCEYASVGSWPDASQAGEVSAQASRACPALNTLVAPTTSAFSWNPQAAQAN
jgi:hypothetical protein